MTASTLSPDLEPAARGRALQVNLCRCTGYRAIADALDGTVVTEKPTRSPSTGRSHGAPATDRIVTGLERYTLDLDPEERVGLARGSGEGRDALDGKLAKPLGERRQHRACVGQRRVHGGLRVVAPLWHEADLRDSRPPGLPSKREMGWKVSQMGAESRRLWP